MDPVSGCNSTTPPPRQMPGTSSHAAPVAASGPSTFATVGGASDASAGTSSLGENAELASVLTRLVTTLQAVIAALQARMPSGGGGAQQPLAPTATSVGEAPTAEMRTPAAWGSAPGNGVTDPALASRWLDYIRASVVSRFADVNQAIAAGYHRNPSSGEYPIHYINDAVFNTADGRDVTMPATLMYERDQTGRLALVGVMLSSDFNKPMPYFGAGQWHRHPGDPQANMHVWFNRTLDQRAFETETGVI